MHNLSFVTGFYNFLFPSLQVRDLETRLKSSTAELEEKTRDLGKSLSSLGEKTTTMEAEKEREVVREKERAATTVAEIQAR